VAGPRRVKQRWVFRTQGRIYADAAVSRDGAAVYVASHDGRLYAVDRDGREAWSYDAKGKIWTSPAVGRDGTIYIGSDADRLVAVDPYGAERWVFSTEQPAKKGDKPEAGRYDVDSSPLLLPDGSVVFGCHTNLFALRPLSGGLRWMFEAGVGRAKIFTSPAMGHDGTIYFGTQGNFFFALSQSASVLWNRKTGDDNDSTAAVGDDGTVYFGSDDGFLRAVAPGGGPRWETDLGRPVRAPVSVGHDGTVIASTFGTEPFIAAFDPRDGTERWRFRTRPGEGAHFGIQSGALIDADGYVYFGARDHHVYCLSPTGALVWEFETGDQVDSGPVMGPDGTVYVGSDDHRLYAFER
jgi:outer membrane protein assembly factor BamB